MSSWHSYPKIYNLGHAALSELFVDSVTVEEKVDGSQFSFGVFDGELRCRSKGQQLIVEAPEKLFDKAVETAQILMPKLVDGWTYRAEYLRKPKHNSLAYDRHPLQHLIIFDISPSEETYLPYEEKKAVAERLGLECVPLLYEGCIKDAASLLSFMDTVSCLGGQKIEGMVIKNYKKFGPDKKVLLGKHVSEAFKEIHRGEWKKSNPTHSDILSFIGHQHKTPARWQKAVQHLKEQGLLEGTPKDIGALFKELHRDIKEECTDEISAQLLKWALPTILRTAVSGFPEWYKNELVKNQFNKD